MLRIDLVFFDAGGGHRAAANALKLAIEQSGRAWDVRLMNLQEVLDQLDIFRKLTGVRSQDVYNLLLRKGWTLGSEYMVPVMHAIIRTYHRPGVAKLSEYWRRDAPDMLVSLVPNFNRILLEGYRKAGRTGPYVTILTDMADYPPHFWVEQQDQWFVAGTQKAVEQALAIGHPRERVLRTSGMILHPRFYETPEVDRAAERRKLGLDPDRLTGLVMFGGFGSAKMAVIARKISEAKLPVQMIFICGRNEKLRSQLMGMKLGYPVFIEGFTQEVPRYMRIADFFIGKPGPASISEALQLHLPVIVERNAWTLPQERYNADWLIEQGLGLAVRHYDDFAEAIRTMPFEELRRKAAAVNNRAVFEIPEMLEKIWAQQSTG